MPGSTTAADRAQYRVLIVDDEVQIAKCLRRLLIRAGFEVAIALGPHEALELLDDFQPDLVLSDFRMPRMNGAELLGEVRRRAPLAVRVIASGCADVEAVSAGLEVGVIGCVLRKPWDDGDLVSELRRLLAP